MFVAAAAVDGASEGGTRADSAQPGLRSLPRPAAIRVFLVSDFELLRQGLSALLANRTAELVLAGWSARLDAQAPPWGNRGPDLVLLDCMMPMAPAALLDSLRRLVAATGLRVLLLGHPQRAELQNQALLAGARGVLERGCPYEQVLTAITHVHRGDLWLDARSTARLLQAMRRRDAPADDHGAGQPAEGPPWQRLSARERHILQVLLRHAGSPAKMLAQQLSISESTLRNHLTSIYSKLGVRNRNGLLFHAMASGMAPATEPASGLHQPAAGI